MNEKLIKILERYELDKPILMHDKLDIIWDKNEQKKEEVKAPKKDTTESQEKEKEPEE